MNALRIVHLYYRNPFLNVEPLANKSAIIGSIWRTNKVVLESRSHRAQGSKIQPTTMQDAKPRGSERQRPRKRRNRNVEKRPRKHQPANANDCSGYPRTVGNLVGKSSCRRQIVHSEQYGIFIGDPSCRLTKNRFIHGVKPWGENTFKLSRVGTDAQFPMGIGNADWGWGKSVEVRSRVAKGRARRSVAYPTRVRACCRGAMTVTRQRLQQVPFRSRGRGVSSLSKRQPRERLVAHAASTTGGPRGVCSRCQAARGRRCSGPWPPCGQRVPSVPAIATSMRPRSCSAGGVGGGWRRWRHWRRAGALRRLARTPDGERRSNRGHHREEKTAHDLAGGGWHDAMAGVGRAGSAPTVCTSTRRWLAMAPRWG